VDGDAARDAAVTAMVVSRAPRYGTSLDDRD
jgi:hypothetical protein